MKKALGIGLIALGGACLFAGIGLDISGASLPGYEDLGFWMPLTGVPALMGGTLLLVLHFRAPKRLVTTPAEGTIVGIRTTGTVINGRPEIKYTVRFTTEAGQEVTADDYVHDGWLHNDTSTVTLHYNPAKPEQIRIDSFGDAAAGAAADGPGVTYGTGNNPGTGSGSPHVQTIDLGNGHSMITISGDVSVSGTSFGRTSSMAASSINFDQGDLADLETLLDRVQKIRQRSGNPDPNVQVHVLVGDASDSSANASGVNVNLSGSTADPSGPLSAEDQDRIASGVPTRGVILQSSPTGAIVGDCAALGLRVEVTRPDGTRFQADTVQPVPQPSLPLAVPGSVVNVYYKPGDEQHITVRFGGGTPPAPTNNDLR